MAQSNAFRGRRRRLNNVNNRQNATFRVAFAAMGWTRLAHEGLLSAAKRWRVKWAQDGR